MSCDLCKSVVEKNFWNEIMCKGSAKVESNVSDVSVVINYS